MASSGIEQHSGVQRVRAAMTEAGVPIEVVVMDQPTPTAVAAAELLGIEVARIANSLIFRGQHSEHGQAPILVLASGADKIDPWVVTEHTGWRLQRADADYVKGVTGFTIGGVAPVGHTQPIVTFLDSDLSQFDSVWAAAGHVHTMFEVSFADLQRATGAQVIAVR